MRREERSFAESCNAARKRIDGTEEMEELKEKERKKEEEEEGYIDPEQDDLVWVKRGETRLGACVICMEEELRYAAIPCGHMYCCEKDSDKERSRAKRVGCAICRAKVLHFVAIFPA